MYCPSCGFEYTQKTNYCKRCGEDLNPAGATDAPKKTQPIVAVAIMFLGVIAFCLMAMGLLLATYDSLSGNGLDKRDEKLLAFVGIFSSVVTLLLIWQLARMVTAFRRSGGNVTVEKHFIREVPTLHPVAPTGQMPEALAAIDPSSVVEHTTRQMAGVYGEPKAMK
jgi:uncharacterized paraquat-inducible protein A